MKKVLLWGIGGIVAIVVVASVASGGKKATTNTGDSNAPAPQAASAKPAKKSADEIYAAVQNGMTKEEVVQVAGRQPDNCIDSDIAGVGPTSSCSYGSVSISLINGKVTSKTKL